ncbi:hypothetical protein [Pararhodobacter sp. CCB-MM2]|uniref:hypothetical protein n=1 Tax=Pararhodobacter sp. CCB-MM2 TaxID=1786003 RepID=UPI001111D073|nr:hypothetical protein [Pararhodobacter sp. CCB-MM2]
MNANLAGRRISPEHLQVPGEAATTFDGTAYETTFSLPSKYDGYRRPLLEDRGVSVITSVRTLRLARLFTPALRCLEETLRAHDSVHPFCRSLAKLAWQEIRTLNPPDVRGRQHLPSSEDFLDESSLFPPIRTRGKRRKQKESGREDVAHAEVRLAGSSRRSRSEPAAISIQL